MRLNKQVQYGLLLVLYLARSGRSSVENISTGLGVSYSFSEKIARLLRLAGVLKSVRGPNGGYELIGEPKVSDVFNAVSPVKLLSTDELKVYNKGQSEHRSLSLFAQRLTTSMQPYLSRSVRDVGRDLVIKERTV